jgi:hypothetical protein
MTGWLLHYKIIKLTRLPHQVMFSLLLLNLAVLLFVAGFLSFNFILYFTVLLLLLLLPFGKKGGKYHIIISSAAMIVYIFAVIIN